MDFGCFLVGFWVFAEFWEPLCGFFGLTVDFVLWFVVCTWLRCGFRGLRCFVFCDLSWFRVFWAYWVVFLFACCYEWGCLLRLRFEF